MILMRVKALAHDPEGQAATLILEDLAGDVALGFVIPMNEANRLARALGLTPCQRAPIYELLHDVLREVRGVIARAVLDHEPGGVCAALVLEHEGTSVALPCHPADAVALAVRTGAPIYATAAALARGCVLRGPVPDGSHDRMGPPRPATTAEWLERVRPADFGSTLPACDAEP